MATLVAPSRAILRYYRCDTPYRAMFFSGRSALPEMVRYPSFVLSFTQAHLCDTPFCNVSHDTSAISHKKRTKKFCDTIATSIARYEKYRSWASKMATGSGDGILKRGLRQEWPTKHGTVQAILGFIGGRVFLRKGFLCVLLPRFRAEACSSGFASCRT